MRSGFALSVFMLFALAAAFAGYVSAEKAIREARELRQTSLLRADELRRTSDELTQMARSYVLTGNPRFRDYYEAILDIRDGRKPRPAGYHELYWQLRSADPQPLPASTGTGVALLELIGETGVAEQELKMLQEAKSLSDSLTQTERAAMRLLDSVGPAREAALASARLILFDDRYLAAKARIMTPIHAFSELVDRRTGEAVQAAEARARVLLALCAALCIGLLFMLGYHHASLRRIAERLRQNEAQLRLSIDGAKLGVFEQKVDADEAIWSERFCAQFGVPDAAEPSFALFLSLLHPDDRERVEALVRRSMATHEDYQAEYRIILPDGSLRWISAMGRTFLAADNRPELLCGVTSDITERKENEEKIRASEQRYRELSANLEHEVDLRTAELRAASAALRQSEAKMRRMLDNIPTAIAALSSGDDARVLFLNEHFVRSFGYSRADLQTLQDWEERAYPDAGYRAAASSWWRERVREAVRSQGKVESQEVRVTCKDGTLKQVVVGATAMDDVLLISLLDISERYAVEKKLRISEERHRLWADNSIDLVWNLGPDGVVTYISPSVERLLGYTQEEFRKLSLAEMFSPASYAIVAAGFADSMANVQAGRPVDFTARELEHRRKDGSYIWVEITASGMYDRKGRFLELMGITRDISARKLNERERQQARDALAAANRALQESNAELQQLAATDVLTRLWNRRHFEQAASAAMGLAERYGDPLSLIMFDIDHFKSINDRWGHQAGDRVLIEMAQRVRASLRAVDVLARWGGEEFVVMMPHGGGNEAIQVAEKVREQVAAEPFPGVGTVTASFGVSQFLVGESADSWIQRADEALYRAKREGRNRVVKADAQPLRLVWRAGYASGEARIDAEHRELFRLANELIGLVASEPSPTAVLPKLDALLAHVAEHFRNEEEILRRCGYADLKQHAGLHRHLLERAEALRARFAQGDGELARLMDFLAQEVIVIHMLKQDRAFFPTVGGEKGPLEEEAG
ncbi:diguanylate cyclase [Rhodocyclus purpureus]|uniref:diguanylate cyclase n=1 Tax=Rhodocyclus purpureus TaxID=1067 RepID=UPI001913C15E